MARLRIKRGTRAQIEAAKAAGQLAAGEPYLITNENALAVGTGANGYEICSVPAGAVMHFAMVSAPSGWLKANGAAVSRTTYAALFAAIGTTFGAGNGSTTFNLPDLRGEFVRGVDDGRGVDAGRAIGTFQGDLFKSHTHTATTTGTPNGDSNSIGYAGGAPVLTERNIINSTGGIETRPRNIALLACIKY